MKNPIADVFPIGYIDFTLPATFSRLGSMIMDSRLSQGHFYLEEERKKRVQPMRAQRIFTNPANKQGGRAMQLTLSSFNEHQKAQIFVLWLSYGLYILFFTAPIGFVISYIKSREYKSLFVQPDDEESHLLHVLATHHQWLVTTFVVTLLFAMVAAGTSYYGIGIVLAALIPLWWIYRLGRGVINLAEHKPMPLSMTSPNSKEARAQ